MALTETLGNVGNPYSAVDPGQKPSGFISGLSALGSMVIQGLPSAGATAASDYKAAEGSAQNAATQAIFDEKARATAAMHPTEVYAAPPVAPGFAPEIEGAIPQAVTDGAARIARMRVGVKQGTADPDAVQFHGEVVMNKLFAQYPEFKYAISKVFKEAGVDNQTFRELSLAQAAADQGVKDQATVETTYITAAATAGLITPDTPRNEQILIGQQFLERKTRTELAEKQVTMTVAATKEEQAQQDRFKTQNQDTYVRDSITHNQAVLSPILNMVNLQATQAVDSPEGSKLLWENINKLSPAIATMKSTAMQSYWKSPLATKDGAATLEKYYDDAGKSVTDVMTGDLSQVKTNALIFTNMQNQLKIDGMKALPLWSMFKEEFGAQAMGMMFGGMPSQQLSADTQKAIRDELSGITPGNLDGMYHVRRVGQILRGEIKIENIDPKDATKTFQDVVTATVGNRDAINRGDMSPATATRFVNGISKAINTAGVALSPTSDMKSQVIYAQINSTPASYTAAVNLIKNPSTEADGQEALKGMREGAAHAYGVATRSGETQNGTGIQKLVWDNKSNRWAIQFDRKAYDRYAAGVASQSYSGSMVGKLGIAANVPSFEDMTKTVDPKLNDKLFTLNSHLHMLVTTAAYDPNVPKGANPTELSRYYGLGEVMPSAVAARKAAEAASAGQPKVPTFADQSTQLSQAITGLTTQAAAQSSALSSDTMATEADKANPTETALRVALAEDASNPVGTLSAIVNRSLQSGKSLLDVIAAPNQFEAYSTGAHHKVSQAQVDAAMKNPEIQKLLNGEVPAKYRDVTHFYSPELQSKLGRSKPAWDTGKGFDVGGTRFFRG